jgi:hypothetical protein
MAACSRRISVLEAREADERAVFQLGGQLDAFDEVLPGADADDVAGRGDHEGSFAGEKGRVWTAGFKAGS